MTGLALRVRRSDTRSTEPRARRRRPTRLWLGGMVALMVVLATAPAASADTTSSTTTTTLPPAPPGFADTVVSTYQSELATAQALGQGQGLETLPQYQQQISALDANALAAFYQGTQQVPEWTQIPSLMQTIAAEVPPGTAKAAKTSAFVVEPGLAKAQSHPVSHAVLGTARPRSAILVATPVTPFQPAQQCIAAPPEAAIFAAQIVADVAAGLYNAEIAAGEGELGGFNDIPASAVAAAASVILLIAQIVHDVLVFLLALSNDCNNANVGAQVANIDNTTVQTYGLITTLTSLVVQIQSTQNTTQQDVLNMQTNVASIQLTLQQALTSDTQTLQQSAGSQTQSTSTELQVIQTALQQDISTLQALETSTSQLIVNGVNKISTSISTDLTQILHEIDVNAQGLTTLVTQNDQQIMNTLQTQFGASQGQYNELLKLQIEEALAGFGPVVPEVKFMLPASKGGFLNSTPVGVQSVVTGDLASMQAIGFKVKSSAVTFLNLGNTALAAGQYMTAFTDYAYAYQGIA